MSNQVNIAEQNFAQLRSDMYASQAELQRVLPKHISPDRMIRTALTALRSNDKLLQCTRESVLKSLMTAAQLGLEPGVNGQCFLVPFNNICQFVPGWRGLVDLVSRTGRATVWTGAVFDGDSFDYQLGDDPFCRHRPGDNHGEGMFSHVYAIGRVKDSQVPIIEVWTRKRVEARLEANNKQGANHYAKKSEHNFEMYARKIALLQVIKYMPSSQELSEVVEIDAAAEKWKVVEGEFSSINDQILPAPKNPPCPDSEFEKNLDRWREAVQSKKVSVESIISKLSSRYSLTAKQRTIIFDLEDPENINTAA